MTLEIRQMVIKSSIEPTGAGTSVTSGGKPESRKEPTPGAEEGMRLRAALQAQLERLQER